MLQQSDSLSDRHEQDPKGQFPRVYRWKQPNRVRDYYLGTDWDHTPPAPRLPSAVIDGTRSRYVEAYELLTERSFDEWHQPEGPSSDEDRRYD